MANFFADEILSGGNGGDRINPWKRNYSSLASFIQLDSS